MYRNLTGILCTNTNEKIYIFNRAGGGLNISYHMFEYNCYIYLCQYMCLHVCTRANCVVLFNSQNSASLRPR